MSINVGTANITTGSFTNVTATNVGGIGIASTSDISTGTNKTKAITPSSLSLLFASTGAIGVNAPTSGTFQTVTGRTIIGSVVASLPLIIAGTNNTKGINPGGIQSALIAPTTIGSVTPNAAQFNNLTTSSINSTSSVLATSNDINGSQTGILSPSYSWTAIGSAQISTGTKKFGAAACNLITSGSAIETTLTAPSGSWTIEFWFYPEQSSTLTSLIGNSSEYLIAVAYDTTESLSVYLSSNGTTWNIALSAQSTNTVSPGAWAHFALEYDNFNYYMYLNGVQTLIANTSKVLNASAWSTLTFGDWSWSSDVMDGYIDELRISNIARYKNSFTPSTIQFVRDLDTLVLNHFNGSNGSNNFNATEDLVQLGYTNTKILTPQSIIGMLQNGIRIGGTSANTGNFTNVTISGDLTTSTSITPVQGGLPQSTYNKGDIPIGFGGSNMTVLPVGSNGMYLRGSIHDTTGIAWQSPASSIITTATNIFSSTTDSVNTSITTKALTPATIPYLMVRPQPIGSTVANTGAFSTLTVLNGTTLANSLTLAQGGTGFTTYTANDMLIGNVSGTLSKLAVGSRSQFLKSDITKTLGLSWATPTSGGGTSSSILDYSYVSKPTKVTNTQWLFSAIYLTDNAGNIFNATNQYFDLSIIGADNGIAKSTSLSGTVSINPSNPYIITGSGTTFSSTFVVGDIIYLPSASAGVRITAINSNTSLTIENPITNSNITWARYNNPACQPYISDIDGYRINNSKFGIGSLYLDSYGLQYQVTFPSNIYPSTWTIEFFVYWQSNNNAFIFTLPGFIQIGTISSSACAYFNVNSGTTNIFNTSYTPPVGYSNVWGHVALTYDGSYYRIYLDGVLQAISSSGQSNIPPSAFKYAIIGGVNSSNPMYIDEFRFSSIPRYTSSSSFSVPTTAFTYDSNTISLQHFDILPASGTASPCNNLNLTDDANKFSGSALTYNRGGYSANTKYYVYGLTQVGSTPAMLLSTRNSDNASVVDIPSDLAYFYIFKLPYQVIVDSNMISLVNTGNNSALPYSYVDMVNPKMNDKYSYTIPYCNTKNNAQTADIKIPNSRVVSTLNTGINGIASGAISGLLGTVSSTTITGNNTTFYNDLRVGDVLTINGQSRKVTAISSNTTLTVGSAYTSVPNWTGQNNNLVGTVTAPSGSGKVLSLCQGAYTGVVYPSNITAPTGAWTIELWFYPVQITSNTCYLIGDYTSNSMISLSYSSSGGTNVIYFAAKLSNYTSININSQSQVQVNSWNHVAIQWTGTTYVIMLNGNYEPYGGSAYTNNSNRMCPAMWNNLVIGSGVEGYLSMFRISNIARYSAIFTPSTSFSSDANTLSLNTFASTGLIASESISGVTWTSINPSYTKQQYKFGISSASFKGGSNNQMFLSPNGITPPTDGWTIEMWFIVNTVHKNYNCLIGNYNDNVTKIGINANGVFYCYISSSGSSGLIAANVSGTTFISLQNWHHFALVYTGSNYLLFLDGLVELTFNVANPIHPRTFTDLVIGRVITNGSWNLNNCNIDELRVSSIARYTSTFSIATAPFIRDSNTLLLNHFNANDQLIELSYSDAPITAPMTGSYVNTNLTFTNATLSSSSYTQNTYFQSNWFDLSGYNNNANYMINENSGGSSSLITVGTINGKNTTNFSNTNVSNYFAAVGPGLLSNGYSMTIVLNCSAANSTTIWAATTFGGSIGISDILFNNNGTSGAFQYRVSSTSVSSSFVPTVGSTYIVTIIDSISSVNIYVNGTNIMNSTAFASIAQRNLTELSIGGWTTNISGYSSYNGGGFNGLMGEIQFYNNTITSTQRQQIEYYLAQKWNVSGLTTPSSPLASQPIYSAFPTGLTNWFDGSNNTSLITAGSPFGVFGSSNSLFLNNTGFTMSNMLSPTTYSTSWTFELWYYPTGGSENNGGTPNNVMSSFYGSTTTGLFWDQWNHIAAVYTNGNTYFYNNGVLQNTDGSSYSGTFWNSLTIGSGYGYIDEVRLSTIARYSGTPISIPTGVFIGDSNTLYLNHFDSTIKNTNITGTGMTNNNASFDNTTVKFGTSSLYLNNLYANISTYNSSVYFSSIGNTPSNWTIECWVNLPAIYNTSAIFSTLLQGMLLTVSPTGVVTFKGSANGSTYAISGSSSAGAITLATWTHIAVVFSGSNYYVYIGGVVAITITSSSTINSTAFNTIGLGVNLLTSSNYLYGNIDELRISNSIRYASGTTFTPSASAFTSDSATLCLSHFDYTNTNVASLSDFSIMAPMTPSYSYTSNVMISELNCKFGGTSALFNNTSFTIVSPLVETAYTLEFWLNITTLANTTIFQTTGYGLKLINNSAGYLTIKSTTAESSYDLTQISSSNISSGAWVHIAVTVSTARNIVLYLNGSSVATLSGANFVLGNITFGYDGSNYLSGFIDELRLSRSLRYSATFTPAIYVFTRDPLTLILNHFDTSYISDFNVTEDYYITNNPLVSYNYTPSYNWSVYNSAAISRERAVFGVSSLKLISSSNQYAKFSGGANTPTAWTLEFYIYPTDLNNQSTLCADANGLFDISISTTGYILVSVGASAFGDIFNGVSSSNNVSASAWSHIALVFDSSNYYLYVNGTQTTIALVSTNLNTNTFNSLLFGSTSLNITQCFNGYIDELRIKNIVVYSGTFVSPSVAFLRDSSTLILNHFDNINGYNSLNNTEDRNLIAGSTTASNSVTITAYNSCATSNAAYYFGSGSLYTNRTSIKYMRLTGLPTVEDWCIEAWVYLIDTSASYSTLFSASTNYTFQLVVDHTNSNKLGLYVGNGSTSWSVYNNSLSTNTISTGVWTHIAVCYSMSLGFMVFYNGIVNQKPGINIPLSSLSTIYIGSNYQYSSDDTKNFNGYFDEFRYSNCSRYSVSPFCPVSAPFVRDTSTVVLMHFEETSGSTPTQDLTVYNLITPSWTLNSNYVVTGSASNTIGGSIVKYGLGSLYLNGSYCMLGNVVMSPQQSWTVEFYFYTATNASASRYILNCTSYSRSTSYQGGMLIGTNTSGNIVVSLGSNNSWDICSSTSSSNTLSLNAWNFVAVEFTGSFYNVYLNGTFTQLANTTTTIHQDTFKNIIWGIYPPSSSSPFVGYIDEFRMSSIARYTQNNSLTPSAPFIGDSYTVLLNHFNSLTSFSNSPSDSEDLSRYPNELVTYTNAGASPALTTSLYKFGQSSISFNGSSQYCYLNKNWTTFFNNRWTIECWVYITSSSVNTYIMSNGVTNNGLAISVISSYISVYLGNSGFNFASPVNSSNAYNLNAWNHIALVYSYNGYWLYLNGYATQISNNTGLLNSYPIALGYYNGTYFAGNLDELRISSIARYNTNTNGTTFNVPTSPFTLDRWAVCLNHFDGLNGSTNLAITEDTSIWGSYSPLTYIIGNLANISNTLKKFGYSSANFSKTADCLFIGGLVQPMVPWTIEGWIYQKTTSNLAVLFSSSNVTSNSSYLLQGLTGDINNYLNFNYSSPSIRLNLNDINNSVVNNATTFRSFQANTWHHISLQFDGYNTYSLFIDGQCLNVTTNTNNRVSAGLFTGLTIGGSKITNSSLGGFIDEFRISSTYRNKNNAFTPYNAPYLTDSNTLMLNHFDNTNEGQLITGAVDTISGITYSSVEYVQIGTPVTKLFNDNTYQLQGLASSNINLSNLVVYNLPTSWTLESWFFVNGNYGGCVATPLFSCSGLTLAVNYPNNKIFLLTPDNVLSVSNTSFNFMTWNHIAIVYTGTTYNVYYNGTNIISYTASNSILALSNIYIGSDYNYYSRQFNNQNTSAMVSNFRVSNIMRYSSNFSVPSSAFSADSSTISLNLFNNNTFAFGEVGLGLNIYRGGFYYSTIYYLYVLDNLSNINGLGPCYILSTRNVEYGDTLVDLPVGYSTDNMKQLSCYFTTEDNLANELTVRKWSYIKNKVIMSNIIPYANTSTSYNNIYSQSTIWTNFLPPNITRAKVSLQITDNTIGGLIYRLSDDLQETNYTEITNQTPNTINYQYVDSPCFAGQMYGKLNDSSNATAVNTQLVGFYRD